jgi:hypothetical protein
MSKARIFQIALLSLFQAIVMKGNSQETTFQAKNLLSKELGEISGIAKDGNFIWAIIDSKNASFYKLDESGKIIQTIHISNVKLKDVEAISIDKDYLYIADVGDNSGIRPDRTIIRIKKSTIPKSKVATVSGELIKFTFPDEGVVKNKKNNNYDCEAVLNYMDSIYVFTKRRDDLKSALYVIPKVPGTYSARFISVLKTKGLVTDAAIDERGNNLALIGYDEDNHTKAFIWLLSNFKGDDFFSGREERFRLTNQKMLDWQLESICYKDENSFYIACEKTKDVPNTLYVIKKTDLIHSDKGE